MSSGAWRVEYLFGTVGSVGQLSDEELERLRRSIAMLSPRQPCGISRELAIDIIEDLQRCRRGWQRLAEGLGDVLSVAQRALGRPSTGSQHRPTVRTQG
jgi:hypothetical protein